MVKKLEGYLKKAFSDLGFSDEEIQDGCWLLERNNKGIAWIALHKFLERVAQRADINFETPTLLSVTEKEIALCVSGKDKNGKSAWSIGEASLTNCKNDYRWAMAEKRAKDRVILKLLGIAGDMYSEEEADEFKKGSDEFQKEVAKQATKITKEQNKKLKEYQESEDGLRERFTNAMNYINKLSVVNIQNEALMKTTLELIGKLREKNLVDEASQLESLIDSKMPKDDDDKIIY